MASEKKKFNKDINQTLRFNIEEYINLYIDMWIIWLRIKLSMTNPDLKEKVIEYMLDILAIHISSIKKEREVLYLLKKSNKVDIVSQILNELDEIMNTRFTDYDKFLASYEELIYEGFNEYNYKHLSNNFVIIDDDKVKEYQKILNGGNNGIR